MPDERSKQGELTGFEAHLAALVPRADIDRDRLMFEAGARAARRRLQVVNRLLAAACVLLGVTTLAPLALRGRADFVAQEEPKAAEVGPAPAHQTVESSESQRADARRLPDRLVVADSRELAAALAEGRSDLRPVRLRALPDEPGGSPLKYGAESQPKSSRALLREYLEVDAARL